MMANKNFTLHMESPAPFFFNAPNVGFRGDDVDSHLPSIVERRLDDLGHKHFLMACAYDKICELTQSIGVKYDASNKTLRVAGDYWELVLFLNHFLFEARSALDLLAIVLRRLHGNTTPQSFNKLEENGKHAAIFHGDMAFHRCLVSAKSTDWMRYLLSEGGKTSLRDRAAHYTVARVNIFPRESGSQLTFRIHADMNAGHPMGATTGLELTDTVAAIRGGMDQLLNGFRLNYTQERIRSLLGIEENAEGRFNQTSEDESAI